MLFRLKRDPRATDKYIFLGYEWMEVLAIEPMKAQSNTALAEQHIACRWHIRTPKGLTNFISAIPRVVTIGDGTPENIGEFVYDDDALRLSDAAPELLAACEGTICCNGHTFECECSQRHDHQMDRTPRCIESCLAIREAVALAGGNINSTDAGGPGR